MHSANASVGTTDGQFEVDDSGKASFAVTIDVPPGIAGVAPKLAIAYSTAAGNGLLGQGAHLSGLSAISRCSRNLALDGYSRGAALDANDAYCLDGSRLVLMSGTHGQTGAMYHTAVESFQKIEVTQHNTHADGSASPLSWKVRTASGAEILFGTSLTDRLETPDGIALQWSISEFTDKNDNSIQYVYQDFGLSGAHESLPTQIKYGINSSEGADSDLRVEIAYENRSDQHTSYTHGTKVSATQRVSAISTYIGADLVKQWQPTYETAPISGVSRLISVAECGDGESGLNCLPPVNLEWSDHQNSWSGPTFPAPLLDDAGRSRGMAIDINGDGRTDWIVAVETETGSRVQTAWLAQADGSWTVDPAYSPPEVLYVYPNANDVQGIGDVSDINGDGLPDWVESHRDQSGDHQNIWLNTGSGWSALGSGDPYNLPVPLVDYSSFIAGEQVSELVDINADGLPDLVQAYRPANGVETLNTWLNTGSAWSLDTAYTLPAVSYYFQDNGTPLFHGRFADLNADGLPDLVHSYQAVSGALIKQFWRNTGTGWLAEHASALPEVLIDHFVHAAGEPISDLIDLNGDGLLDQIRATEHFDGSTTRLAWLNTGAGFVADSAYVPPEALIVIDANYNVNARGSMLDLNSDGLVDFVRSYRAAGSATNSEAVWLNTSSGWQQDNSYILPEALVQQNSGADSLPRATLMDINQDGLTDIVGSGLDGDTATYTGDINPLELPDTVNRIVNSLAIETLIEYAPTTDDSIYTPGSGGSYPTVDDNSLEYVVAAVEASDGAGGMLRAEHSYAERRLNLNGYGGLGFASHSVVDTNTNVVMASQFSQDPRNAGATVRLEKTLNGDLLMETDQQFATYELNSGATWFVGLTNKSMSTYELGNGATPVSTKIETRTYDNYGSVTQSTSQTSDNLGTYRTTVDTTYSHDITNWYLGLATSSQTTSEAPNTPNIIHRVDYSYDNQGRVLSKAIEPTQSAFTVTETYTYGNFGHRTSTTVSGSDIASRTSSIEYSIDGRFPIKAINPLLHEVNTEYDPRWGKVTLATSPNGQVTKTYFNEFGMQTQQIKINGAEDAGGPNDDDGVEGVGVFSCFDPQYTCPVNAAYFIAAFDDQGESPETVYYDAMNREVRKTSNGFDDVDLYDPASVSTRVFVDTQYDSYGRKKAVSNVYFEGKPAYWTFYEFDVLGRVTTLHQPTTTATYQMAGGLVQSVSGASTATTSYNGRTTVTTNDHGQSKTTLVNALGKPVTVTDQLGNTISYQYDAAGRLTKTTDQASNVIDVLYDPMGRKLSQDDPDMGLWQYEYDRLGNLTRQEDAKAQVVTMQYDVLGRISQRSEIEGTTTWAYDTAANGVGRLHTVSMQELGSGTDSYLRSHAYDGMGRPSDLTVTMDGVAHTTTTVYTGTTERVDYMQYPSGLTVRTTYNNYAFPVEIRSNGLNQIEDYNAQILIAQDLVTDAQDYYNANNATRLGHINSAQSYSSQGDALANQAYSKQAEAQPLIDEYEGAVGWVRYLSAQANNLVPELNSLGSQGNSVLAQIDALVAEALCWGGIANTMQANGWEHYPYSAGCGGVTAVNVSIGDVGARLDYISNLLSGHQANANNLSNQYNALEAQQTDYTNSADSWSSYATSMVTQVNAVMAEVQSLSNQANGYYSSASTEMGYANAITSEIGRRNNLAEEATTKIDELYEQYTAASLLHWRGVKADASGKIQEFNQGKYVTTEVGYDPASSLINSLHATSGADVTGGSDDPVADVLLRLQEWIDEFTPIAANYNAEYNVASTERGIQQTALTTQQGLMSSYSTEGDVARALVAEAEVNRLNVEVALKQVEVDLNQNAETTTTTTLAAVQALISQYGTGVEGSSAPFVLHSFHQLEGEYHRAIQAHYLDAEASHRALSLQFLDYANTPPTNLEPLIELGQEQYTLAGYNDVRAQAFETDLIDSGYFAPEIPRTYDTTGMVRDLYQRRSDVYAQQGHVAERLYLPLRELIDQTATAYTDQGEDDIANLYSARNQIGEEQINFYAQAAVSYQARVATVDDALTQIDDALINNTPIAQLSILQTLVSDNTGLADTYTAMSDTTYWVDMFTDLSTQLTGSGDFYASVAAEHDNLAVKAETLASEAQNQVDHVLLASDGVILNDQYIWDNLGNLLERNNMAVDLRETFTYDDLNRLTYTNITGAGAEIYELTSNDSMALTYDIMGNITTKSGVGTYTYGITAGPHAVTSITDTSGTINYNYDANGNMTSGDGRAITYSSYNKPVSMTRAAKSSVMDYGPERQLIKEVDDTTGASRTTYYFGSTYEKILEGPTNTVTHKYHITAQGGGTIAVLIDQQDELPETHYLHRDHLDSIVAITDARGFVIERFFYDAFGQRRTAVGVTFNETANELNLNLTTRGFTGHKQIAGIDVIHMKGRVYDPKIGRFLSADPHIQAPTHSQSYNRYSYVLNNPLSAVDPSGYFLSFLKKAFKAIKNVFKKVGQVIAKVAGVIKDIGKFVKKNIKVIAAIAVVVVAPYAVAAIAPALVSATAVAAGATGLAALTATGALVAGAVGGAMAGFITTGSLKGALQGAVTGAVFAGIGNYYSGLSAGSKLTRTISVVNKGAVATKSVLNVGGHLIKTGVSALASGAISKGFGGSFSKAFVLGGGLAGLAEGAMWLRNTRVDTLTSNHGAKYIKTSAGLGDGQGIGGTTPYNDANRTWKVGATGGFQKDNGNWLGLTSGGKPMQGFGIAYKENGFIDRLIEAFSGPHDQLNAWGYDNTGLLNRFDNLGRTGGAIARGAHGLSAVALIPVAVPFAAASALTVYAPAYAGFIPVYEANDT